MAAMLRCMGRQGGLGVVGRACGAQLCAGLRCTASLVQPATAAESDSVRTNACSWPCEIVRRGHFALALSTCMHACMWQAGRSMNIDDGSFELQEKVQTVINGKFTDSSTNEWINVYNPVSLR